MDKYIGTIIVNSEHDQRVLEYLTERCGAEAVENACGQLVGNRKPYVSNIAKVLGVVIPEHVVNTPRDAALIYLEQLKKLLKGRR